MKRTSGRFLKRDAHPAIDCREMKDLNLEHPAHTMHSGLLQSIFDTCVAVGDWSLQGLTLPSTTGS